MIKKLNNKGVGKKEAMIGLLLIILFIVIVLYAFTGKDDSRKFDNFRKKAINFAQVADEMIGLEIGYENGVYLYDLVEASYMDEMTSPFDSKETCNVYESRVDVNGPRFLVTLRCGEYLIYKQSTTADKLTVYKVSDWKEEKPEGGNFRELSFYNYSVNGVAQFENYYSEKEFLVKYYEKTGINALFVDSLQTGHELLEKTYYQELEKVE